MPAAKDDEPDNASAVSTRRSKTLILDVYGRYAPQFQGWLAVSELVRIMGGAVAARGRIERQNAYTIWESGSWGARSPCRARYPETRAAGLA